MSRTLTCACGATEWQVAENAPGTHLACYCNDCHRYAVHQEATALLDDRGGTEIFQTLPHAVTFTRGHETLALLRLTPKGLLRWYASCCGTPVANTMTSPALPFVGMVTPAGRDGFGPIRARVFTGDTQPPVKAFGFGMAGLGILRRGVMARLRGHGSGAPFFSQGKPVAPATILSESSGNG